MDINQLYIDQILPNLQWEAVLSSNDPKDKGNHITIKCPSCSHHEAVVYKGNGSAFCNRKNNCGYTGNLLSIMNGGTKPTGLKYVDIMKQLCDLSGIEFPEKQYSKQEIEKFESRNRKQQLLYDFKDLVFQELDNSPAATAYIEKRGLSTEKVKWRIGFYPHKNIIAEELEKKSYLPSEIQESGLLRDDWNGRILIPLEEHGVIGDFIAGDITRNATDAKKYLRMNGDNAYDNAMLLGLEKANRDIILVEGVFDYLSLDDAGIKNVVALGGSQLWDSHIKKLRNHKVKTITLFLDNDEAGINGTLKIIEKLANEDFEVYVADHLSIGESKDPDQFLKENDIESLNALLNKPMHGFEYKANHLLKQCKGSTEWTTKAQYSLVDTAQAFESCIRNQKRKIALDSFWEIILNEANISEDIINQCRKEAQEKKQQHEKKELIENAKKRIDASQNSGDYEAAANVIHELSQTLKEKKADVEDKYSFLFENLSEDRLVEEFKVSNPYIDTGFIHGEIKLALPSGALSFFCAPTGHGKTTLEINVTLGALDRNIDATAYFFSYEEERKKIEAKFINTYFGEPLNKGNNKGAIYHFLHAQGNPSLDPFQYISENKNDFLQAVDGFYNKYQRRLRILQRDLSVEDLVDAIRCIKKNDPNAKLIVIDYMQKLFLKYDKSNARHEAIKEICKQLENCAIETGLAIVLGAQLNRSVNSEDLVKGADFNIAEAHAIAQCAVNIYGIWNRSHNISNPTNEMFITVIKGRDIGRGHDTIMSFDGNAGKIKNIESITKPAILSQYTNTSKKVESTSQKLNKEKFNNTDQFKKMVIGEPK